MTYICFFCTLISPPPPQGTNEFEDWGPQRVPMGGRGRGRLDTISKNIK